MGVEPVKTNGKGGAVVTIPPFEVRPRNTGVFITPVLPERQCELQPGAIGVVTPGIQPAQEDADITVRGVKPKRRPPGLDGDGILMIVECLAARLMKKVFRPGA